MSGPASTPLTVWGDALLAAAMLAVDPIGLAGIHLRARAGPVRDRWLRELAAFFGAGITTRRIAAGISEARLTGGLDIGATLACGRKVVESGVLAAADGGLVLLAMAERVPAGTAAVIAAALDEGQVRIERDGISAREQARFALVALDEGVEADERLTRRVGDRLALQIDLNAIAWRDTEIAPPVVSIPEARARLAGVRVADAMVEALCSLATTFGENSLRAGLHLLRTARAAAALAGRDDVSLEDATLAARLVLGLQARPAATVATDDASLPDAGVPDAPPDGIGAEPDGAAAPQEPAEGRETAPETPSREDDGQEAVSPTAESLQNMVIAAVAGAVPGDLLAGPMAAAGRRGQAAEAGKAGAERRGGTRGRAFGVADQPPRSRARIDVLATLRQAAPWQRLRRDTPGGDAAAGPGLKIRKQDFRFVRYRDRTGTTAIFAVDASGSTALERLAETKGAIELLLSQCYVRRDSVALVAFRGRQAETLLEPTRSLLRAKRSLSALPGGGATPLPGGIIESLRLALAATRRGQSVISVFLTDGRGNVALDGSTLRARVEEDTGRAARQFREAGLRALLIDTAQRPQARAADLARDLGAEYLALPRAGSGAMAREVGARMEG